MPDAPRRGAGRLGSLWAVLERDFVVSTSRGRFLILRVAALAVAAIVVGAVILTGSGEPPDTIGRWVLTAAAVVVPMTVLLVAPAGSAACITSEREGGTLDLVRAAPGNALTFVLAKFLSRLGGLLVLVLGLLPVMGVAFVYGGVGLTEFLEIVQLTLAFAVAGTAIGVLTSAYARSTPAAVLGSFLLVWAGPGIPGLVLGALHDAFDWPRPWLDWILATQPTVAWAAGFARYMGGGAPAVLGPHTAFLAALSGLALVLAVRRMRREGAVPERAGRKARRGTVGVLFERPILDRGLRGSVLRRPRKSAWVVPALVVCTLGFHFASWADHNFEHHDEEFLVTLGIVTLLLAVQVLSASGAAVAVERRNGSLDVLLASPCSARDVVRERFAAAILVTLPSLALAFAYGLVGCIGPLNPMAVLAWLVTSTLLLGFVGALGIRCSVAARSPGAAAVRAFAIMAGLIFGHGLLMFLLAVGGADGDIAGVLATCSAPVLVFVIPFSVREAFSNDAWRSFDSEIVLGSGFFLALHVAVAVMLLIASVRALRRSMDGE